MGIRGEDHETLTPFLAVAVLVAAFSIPAEAKGCMPYGMMKASLAKKYKEQRHAVAMTGHAAMELWVSPQGSWTVFIRLPMSPNVACIVASGHSYTPQNPKPVPKGTAL